MWRSWNTIFRCRAFIFLFCTRECSFFSLTLALRVTSHQQNNTKSRPTFYLPHILVWHNWTVLYIIFSFSFLWTFRVRSDSIRLSNVIVMFVEVHIKQMRWNDIGNSVQWQPTNIYVKYNHCCVCARRMRTCHFVRIFPCFVSVKRM